MERSVVFVMVKEVLLHRVLIWLLDFLSNVVFLNERIILLFSCVVQVRVEVKELAPSVVNLIKMTLYLLTNVNKGFTRHCIIHHHSAATFLPELRREIVGLLFEVINLLGGIRQHV